MLHYIYQWTDLFKCSTNIHNWVWQSSKFDFLFYFKFSLILILSVFQVLTETYWITVFFDENMLKHLLFTNVHTWNSPDIPAE